MPDGPLSRRQSHDGNLHRARPRAPFLQVSRPFKEGVFYLSVVFAGPVRYSLDHLLRNEVGEEEQNPF